MLELLDKPDAETQKEWIKDFIRNASLEITPGDQKKVSHFTDVMNPGRRVFITHLPGADPSKMIDTAIRLRQDGMEPIPHLAARSMLGPPQLKQTLERLRNEADVRDVLIIGGGVDKPVGKFKSTLDMLETGYFEEFGLRSIGVAGHPEGNMDIPEEDIRHALQFKNEYAITNNVHMYIVTQFVFDAAPIFDWLDKIEKWGNKLPVNIGLPGPASIKRLIKYGQMCGVRTSYRFFQRQGTRLFRLASVSTPDYMISLLAQYYAQSENCPITRLHFYNFGGLRRTMKFLQAVENGHFDVKKLTTGFVIHPDL